MDSFKFSDEVIAQVARLVQLAIITGTDIVDNLRMLSVTQSESDKEILVLTDEYRQIAESQITKLMSELEESEIEMT
jgi:hypothetical protein